MRPSISVPLSHARVRRGEGIVGLSVNLDRSIVRACGPGTELPGRQSGRFSCMLARTCLAQRGKKKKARAQWPWQVHGFFLPLSNVSSPESLLAHWSSRSHLLLTKEEGFACDGLLNSWGIIMFQQLSMITYYEYVYSNVDNGDALTARVHCTVVPSF